AAWESGTRAKAAEFWSKSSVHIADPLIESLWYETLHARRCTYRDDTVPPGLFLPSTVEDYSHWHGDYHTNYNIQEPFWADYTANHYELGDAYFRAMDYFQPMGRKIAHDYYNGRGVFIQLTGYPILAEDDVLGCVPMGRMAYMTGWAANQYWWRYQYSMDKEWLRKTGYPFIRDCALFYTDFVEKGPDGLYHAFPSNQGEDGFTGNAKDYTDRAQIMQHMRYCLRSAVQASTVIETDADLRAQWQDILAHCPGDDGATPPTLSEAEQRALDANPPEFGIGRPYKPQPEAPPDSPQSAPNTWYLGQYGWGVMQQLRGGGFIAGRDFPMFRKNIERWRHPNGLVWGMAIANYGHAGAWSETLGILAPLQEMMLQSWDDAIRVFPAWPRNLDASFEDFRAHGAFLVSASYAKGVVGDIRIKSERGGTCRLGLPWPEGAQVLDATGNPVALQRVEDVVTFETQPGGEYVVRKR
ncbi:MAG: glycoside hydrolase family 95-like protein, partial [Candidatus Hydrogenedentales bacterium]